MMSDYIKIVLNSNYEFRCDGELSLYGMRFVMLSFKIDTGCQYSVLPLIRTGLPQNMILQYRAMVSMTQRKIRESQKSYIKMRDILKSVIWYLVSRRLTA